MDYDLIVVKTLERVYKNYYYIIRGEFLLALVKYSVHRESILYNTDVFSASLFLLFHNALPNDVKYYTWRFSKIDSRFS